MTVPPLQLMAIFTYVVDENGFSAAARRLGMSKSAVSKAVSELEEHLGVRLLQRTTRSLRLTDAGVHFHARCARVLREAEEAEREVGRLDGRPRGKVRINAPIALGRLFVLPVVTDILAAHPEVEIELTLQDDYVDLVQTGTDLAIRVGRLLGSTLVAKKIAPIHGHLVASPAYIKEHGQPTTPAELADHPYVAYTLVSRPHEVVLERDGQRETIKVTGRFATNSGEAVLDAVRAKMGIGLAPDFLGADLVCRGELVPVLTDWGLPEVAIYAVYAEAGPVTAALRLVIDALVARAEATQQSAGNLPFGLALHGLSESHLRERGAPTCPAQG